MPVDFVDKCGKAPQELTGLREENRAAYNISIDTRHVSEDTANMPRLRIAHLCQQGQNMVIVPLDSSFGRKTQQEQAEAIEELQMRSRAAGLAGTVVPVWDGGGGRMSFIAPRPWQPFFQRLNLLVVHRKLNKILSW